MSSRSIPPNNTVYIQNLNEKIQKQGKSDLSAKLPTVLLP